MEKVIKEQIIPEQLLKTTYFIAEDGKEFTFERACLLHEEQLKRERAWKSIHKVDTYNEYDIPDLGSITWYFCKTQEELDQVRKYYGRGYWHYEHEMKINTWFGIRCNDGGDSSDSIYVYSYEDTKELIMQELGKLFADIESMSIVGE